MMKQYKVQVTFKSTVSCYETAPDESRTYYMDAESDILAVASVINEIRENGPDLDMKGLALIELQDTKILY